MSAVVTPPRAGRARAVEPAIARRIPIVRVRTVATFLATTYVIAIAAAVALRALGTDLLDLEHASPEALAIITLLAGAPAVAAIVTRLVHRGALAGWSWGFRRLGGRLNVVALVLPVAYVTASYGIAYVLGIGRFDADRFAADAQAANGSADAAGIVGYLALTLGGGALMLGVLALLEEIGWRGFLVPALAQLVPANRVAILSGVAWAVFHFPMMLLVAGADHGLPAWYGLTTFTLVLVGGSVAYVWLRLRGRSIWPAVVLHTVHNVLIYNVFEPYSTGGELAPYALGELGLALVITSAIMAVALWRRAVDAAAEVREPAGAGGPDARLAAGRVAA